LDEPLLILGWTDYSGVQNNHKVYRAKFRKVKEVNMKRYGDNHLSSNTQEQDTENEGNQTTQVIRGGCSVRYGMLDFLASAELPQERKPSKISAFFKRVQKKVSTNES
jgi:hypothetical protein